MVDMSSRITQFLRMAAGRLLAASSASNCLPTGQGRLIISYIAGLPSRRPATFIQMFESRQDHLGYHSSLADLAEHLRNAGYVPAAHKQNVQIDRWNLDGCKLPTQLQQVSPPHDIQ